MIPSFSSNRTQTRYAGSRQLSQALGFMRKLIANNMFMLFLSIAVALGGFTIGWLRHDFTAFARAGALLVGFGIIVLSRTFITRTEFHPFIGGAETGLNVYEREHWQKIGKPIHPTVFEQEHNRFALGLLGPSLSFAGTVIWAFGDLLNKVWLS